MALLGFGLGLIIFHGVHPGDSLMANCNKITAYLTQFYPLIMLLLKARHMFVLVVSLAGQFAFNMSQNEFLRGTVVILVVCQVFELECFGSGVLAYANNKQ